MLYFILILFAIATALHAGFLTRTKKIQNREALIKLWRLHYPISGIVWLVLLVTFISIQFTAVRFTFSPTIKMLGLLVGVFGLYLSVKSMKSLGLRKAMGSRFFFTEEDKRVKVGLYEHLKNPMYDGFFLIIIGLGCLLGIYENFYIAGASFILLNLVLARFENYSRTLNPF